MLTQMETKAPKGGRVGTREINTTHATMGGIYDKEMTNKNHESP